jgi:Prp8 binding protein
MDLLVLGSCLTIPTSLMCVCVCLVIWEAFGENANIGLLSGHKKSVLDLDWSSDGEYVYSCSADKSVVVWDIETGKRKRAFKGHETFVNS